MNVTTPIAVPVAVATDGGTSGTPTGATGVEGEFSDALAGFLTDTPGDGDTTVEGAEASTDLPAPALAAPDAPAQVAAASPAATPLLAAVALGYAFTPAALNATPAALSEEAVTGANPATGIPATSSLAATSTAAGSDTALASSTSGPVAASGSASAVSAAMTATADTGASPALLTPTGTTATTGGDGAGTGVDVQAAARALGLTLTTAPTGSTPTGTEPATSAEAAAPAGSADTASITAPDPTTPPAAVLTGPSGATASSSASATLPAPAPSAPRPVHVAHQFATQLAALTTASNGVHTMTIQITPDDLGPVQVQVTLTDGVVDMAVLTALEVGRDTITQAAPDLRRYLEAAGLTCNSVEVDLSNDQSSWLAQPDAEQDPEARNPSNGREQAGTPSGDIDEPNPASVATRSPSSTSTGVDLQI